VSVCYRQKVCERLIRDKVVQLQSELKSAAVAMIKQLAVNFTAKAEEIGVVRRAMMSDVMTTRKMIESVRTSVDQDGMNGHLMLESLSSSLASIHFIYYAQTSQYVVKHVKNILKQEARLSLWQLIILHGQIEKAHYCVISVSNIIHCDHSVSTCE